MSNLKQSVKTNRNLDASKLSVWKKVGFYEHVGKKPSLMLRVVLPVPRAVQGNYQKVGDTCRCKYSDGGYLTKEITRIREGNIVEFKIIEQSIRFKSLVTLLGGEIEVVEQQDGSTAIRMVTHYESRFIPRWLAQFSVDKVIRRMHKFVIDDMEVCLSR